VKRRQNRDTRHLVNIRQAWFVLYCCYAIWILRKQTQFIQITKKQYMWTKEHTFCKQCLKWRNSGGLAPPPASVSPPALDSKHCLLSGLKSKLKFLKKILHYLHYSSAGSVRRCSSVLNFVWTFQTGSGDAPHTFSQPSMSPSALLYAYHFNHSKAVVTITFLLRFDAIRLSFDCRSTLNGM